MQEGNAPNNNGEVHAIATEAAEKQKPTKSKYGTRNTFGAIQAEKYRARKNEHTSRLAKALELHGLSTSSVKGERKGQTIIRIGPLLHNTIRIVKDLLAKKESGWSPLGASSDGCSSGPGTKTRAASDSMHWTAFMASSAIATLSVRVPDLTVTESNAGMREFCPLGECPGYLGRSLFEFFHPADVPELQNAMREIERGLPTQFQARLRRTFLADDGVTAQSEHSWQTVKVAHASSDKRTVFMFFELADNCRQRAKIVGRQPQWPGLIGDGSNFATFSNPLSAAGAVNRAPHQSDTCVSAEKLAFSASFADPVPSPSAGSFIPVPAARQVAAARNDLFMQDYCQQNLINFMGAKPPLVPEAQTDLSMLLKLHGGALGGAKPNGQSHASFLPTPSCQMFSGNAQTNALNNINDNQLMLALLSGYAYAQQGTGLTATS